ncbi:unnamed protein product [Rhizoctonia solani]|uniref:nicotinate phosphoribosyltransferase n=1 Tax=Rhizoctonia solani TaxID=456999 RepID=A0A8H3ACM8_9AGAM|nr:unnamed protein product [Rhizoctonia solani]
MMFSWKTVFGLYVWVAPALVMASNQTFDAACYSSPLPNISPANDTRSIPWGAPGVKLTNGSDCCNSIEEVRTSIGTIDTQILKLLGERAGYVREAGRFKSNRTSVFNQVANDAVVQRALNSSKSNHIPETIAVEVYQKILETMLAFEYCSNFKADRARAERWRGLRQDSGDPFEFISKAQATYKQMGIDYHKKVIVFSDGLDVELAVKLRQVVDEVGFIGAFGIGTFLTNDYNRMVDGQRSTPLNMVIKLALVEGVPCVKISDDITKNTGDPEVVAQIKQKFNIEA